MNGNALLVYGDLRDGKYERQVVLEHPAAVPVTHLPGITLNVGAMFTP